MEVFSINSCIYLEFILKLYNEVLCHYYSRNGIVAVITAKSCGAGGRLCVWRNCIRIGEGAMKKGFVRFFAGLLTTTLVFSSGGYPAYAVQEKNQVTPYNVLAGVEAAENERDLQTVTGPAVVLAVDKEGTTLIKGSLEVMITAGMEVKSEQEFTITLEEKSKSDSGEAKKIILPKSVESDISRGTVRFPELDKGTYLISVSAPGYVTYQQEVEVEDLAYRIQLYTGKATFEGNHPGLLRKGDINGDGELDEKDADAIVNMMDSGNYESLYDLNGDGKVDMLDLNYFTDFWLNYQVQTATVEKLLPIEAIDPKVSEETIVKDGGLNEMLAGEGEVSLALNTNDIITEENAVKVDFDFSKSQEPMQMEGLVVKTPRNADGTKANGAIVAGEIEIVYEKDGELVSIREAIPDAGEAQELRVIKGGAINPEWKNNGELCINLEGMVAVKLVTLRITKTSGTKNLAKISSVEFLNDMESRIPEPEMNIPTNLQATPGNKQFSLTWDAQKNVTAYEVEVSHEGITESKKVTSNSVVIAQFNKDKMVNNKEYEVRVQSLNGEWKSGFSDSITVTPKPDGIPKAPDGVTVVGGYKSLDVRWKELEDTDTYNVFYKKESDSEFKKVTGITACYYQITDLEVDTKYQVYLTASNELGEGPKSLTAADKTLSGLEEAKLPEYKLINTSNGKGNLSNHIKSASINSAGQMIDSPLDANGTNSALGVFDNDYVSYMYREDWDYGGAYPSVDKGITTELDQVYDIGMITFAEPVDRGAYSHLSVFYWDENGTRQRVQNASIHTRKSGNRNYYLIKFQNPVRTSKIQFGVGRYNAGIRQITISEVRFYEYDSIEQDIMNLYEDSLHIVLKGDVTAQTIQALEDRLNTADPVSGEYHPEKEALQKELDAAKQLLETGGLGGVTQINPIICAANDSQVSVGGMNAWQPLGVSAGAGEEIVVYVGKTGAANGANASVRLVITQQHAESSNLSTTMNLKVGRNEITLPKISTTDVEKGGALYIEYTGNNANDQYAVRVSGGASFPILNLYRITDEQERAKRIQTYIEELKTYVDQLSAKHGEVHSGSQNENLEYSYDPKTCILNLTDIVTDKMMLSIPASQVLAALGKENPEERMAIGIQSMEDMITLFYQHKGLTNDFEEGTEAEIIAKNHIPYRYLNIRYMKMFAGAFMYAAGNHIGIEWGSTTGMVGRSPAVYDENGKWISGQYFGWGIAHEIGHDINQGAYAHAEVTNNYFSVLAQARDTNDSVRFKYSEVFKKVTSNATGYANNVFTQLGMYWQLHLAYDRGYNFKTYNTYQEIFDHIFFARVDSYARNAASAPAPNNIALTLDGDRDQNLMRLASAAAEKDLTEFFIRWGMIPDEKTIAYTGQFEKETRAIYYVDDEARVYEIENGTSQTIKGQEVVTAQAEVTNSEATITVNCSADANVIQGYEVTRIFIDQGEERREIAGFTLDNTFKDNVPFAANRVIIYEVAAVDKFMNRSAVCQTNPVKIGGDGIQDKTHWSVSTNMISEEDLPIEGTDDLPCEATESTIERVIDYDSNTTFRGTANGEDPYVILELNEIIEVAALRFSGQAIGDYKVEISTDGTTYQEVKTGTISESNTMLYFDNGKWICTYDAAFVKLTAVGQSGKEISISELDLYGPSGDNVEFLTTGEQAGIGILSSDYIYDDKGNKIPAGSIVFTGNYKGNPAYNVVVLYDEKGQIVGGTDANGELVAHQIVLAPELGDKALLGETSEGIWIYWFEPSTNISAENLPSKVRAELYRVDNALTNEGQRLVSDTVFETVPETLPPLTLTK